MPFQQKLQKDHFFGIEHQKLKHCQGTHCLRNVFRGKIFFTSVVPEIEKGGKRSTGLPSKEKVGKESLPARPNPAASAQLQTKRNATDQLAIFTRFFRAKPGSVKLCTK